MTDHRCTFTFVDEADALRHLDQAKLQTVIDAALAEDDQTFCALTVMFVDDAASAALHEEHFDDASPTDVMTFPDGSEDPESGRLHLGDLAVGYDVAVREAGERNRPVGEELILYILHGLLHIQGYDDGSPSDLAEMWAVQRRILATVGIHLEAVPT
jgi:probable rRNA maturation factor